MKKKTFLFIITGLSIGISSLIWVHFLNAETATTTDISSTNTTPTSGTITTTTTSTTGATTTTETTTTTTNTDTAAGTPLSVIDTIAPIVKLIGISPLYIRVGSSFVDPGAVAYDNVDGNISTRIAHESNINTALPGTYRVVYGVADRAGNRAHIERVVVVIANVIITTTAISTTTASNITIEPIIKVATTSGIGAPTQVDHVLEILRSENIQRIEAEKRRIIEKARKNKLQQTTSAKETVKETLKDITGTTSPRETLEKIQEKVQKITERITTKQSEALLDSDHDGISDYDEKYIYGTDPYNPDTDGDGYSDGSEILGGYDPHDPDLRGAITYENPQNAGEMKKDILAVSEITTVPQKKENSVNVKEEKDKKEVTQIQLKGSGLPNSFVTIYIFSTPIIVTTRTDSEGNWEYVLDKELPDGNHEMYVAMTDGGGKILAKSIAIPFIKEAAAVTVNSAFLSPRTKGTPPGFFTGEYVYATAVVIFCIIGIILSIIGMRAQPYRYTGAPPRDEQHD